MSTSVIILVLISYFLLLIAVSVFTSRNADTQTFFNAHKSSAWYLVAYGMIGASLSGVTFISVPGDVANSAFAYLQMVFGYFLGYLIIAFVLLPLYYRLNVISIYQYLRERFGEYTYKTGASFFLLSRTVGAAFRLYLMASVLQYILFDAWHIPFYITVLVTIFLIWIYTAKGGIKTVVYTDTLQTTFMLVSLVITMLSISQAMDWTIADMIKNVFESKYAKVWFTEPGDTKYFLKYIISGMFITIVMTGLDQDMMQKNLTCKSLREAQKNMLVFSVILILVNLIFLTLGALLYLYADSHNITIEMLNGKTDLLFPHIALKENLGITTGIFFLLGLIAAAYSSADSALTALTTSACIDIIEIDKYPETKKRAIKNRMHLLFSAILFMVIMLFYLYNDDSVITSLFKAAGFTYGPLLGMYAFGLFTKRQVNDQYVPIVSILSPIISLLIFYNAEEWFNTKIGFEILLYNGLLTFIGLFILSINKKGINLSGNL
jgi:Na+/proline symporter